MKLTWKEQTIETDMTDAEARSVAMLNPSKFAQDIVAKDSLSAGQRFWLHKLAIEHKQPKQPTQIEGLAQVITEMFKNAGEKLKRPNIRLLGSEGVEIRIYPSSTTPDAINVYSAGEYVGRILGGEWRPKSSCPDWVEPALKRFAANPAHAAKEYGRVLGRCCFCSKALETNESVLLGFGPVCGKRYGLIK